MQYHRIEDTSLTSLNWLPDFQIPTLESSAAMQSMKQQYYAESLPPPPTPPDSVFSDDKEREELLLPLSPLKRCMNQTAEFEQDHWRYKNDPNKPPFSYTTIIYLAINSSKNDRVTLGEIYQWIKDHFMYYRLAETTWQNSVRHNLSLNDFFIKIPRSEGDPGKGSFWQINPDYKNVVTNEFEFQRLEELQNNQKMFSGHKTKGKSRRRLSTSSSNGGNNLKAKTTPQKSRRCKSASYSANDVPNEHQNKQQLHLPSDLDWTTLLSSQKMSCGSCTGIHTCQASFGSPVFAMTSSVDDHINCSPAIIPMSLPSRIIETSPNQHQPVTLYNPVLDEIMTSQESPAPLLPPWAESRSQSPNISLEHPWVDSRERSRHMWGGSPEGTSWATIGLPMSGYPSTSSTGSLPVAAQLI